MALRSCIVLAIALILCACSPVTVTPESTRSIPTVDTPPPVIPPSATIQPLPLTKLIATLATPHVDQGPDGPSTSAPTSSMGCAYRWAQQDLPELSNDFLLALQELQPGATGHAFAFGEDCIHDDGTVTFLPMETDFNITLPVSDLSNEAELGDWIIQVMQVIENIPSEQIRGPRPGRVSLLFESGVDRTGVNFYIDQYQALPDNLSSDELFRMLQESQ
ncbi:MAG TPA: hypothetical protein VHO49_06275 [Anaerolineales bacterium]|nr:hypothetical protein [Anaerolineales bacterium]